MANDYTISGTPVDTAVATDPSLCRVSGYLRDVMGRALKGHTIKLRHCYLPMGVFPDALVLHEVLNIVSDAAGYIEFDLYRTSTVSVEFPNRATELYLECYVPDAASVNLLDFLFPYLASVAFDDAAPVGLAVEESKTFTLTGTFSNGQTVELDSSMVVLESSNELVLEPAGGLRFLAVAIGAVQVSVVSVDASPLDLNTLPNGDPIHLFEVPAPTLPAALDVIVS